MWKKDSVIDEMNLGDASRESAKLHSKYLELYSVNKLRLRKLEMQYKVILKEKFMHYNGKLSQEELKERDWSPDPLNGLTVLKGDMDKWYDSDPIVQSHQAKMHYSQEMVDTLKEIMENIKWRHQSIKNAIEWHKFTSGM